MKCVSFNVNSIRPRLHQLDAIIKKHQPDFIGLQETKVTDEDFPIEQIHDMGYEVEYSGQKTHYGVALLSREDFVSCKKDLAPDGDEQRRFIAGEFVLDNGTELTVLNAYFPQGENQGHAKKFPHKAQFYQQMQAYLRAHCDTGKHLILMGDMNVAPHNNDIGFSEETRERWLEAGHTSFLPEEREWFSQLLACGLEDSYRRIHPDTHDVFSWFDYRDRGFEREPKRGLRIDFILASAGLNATCTAAGIDYDIRGMEKPSDHCPVWAEFNLS